MLEEFKKRTEKRVRVDGVSEMNSPRSQRVLAELTTELQSAWGILVKPPRNDAYLIMGLF
ncbi:hypothetical protein [Schinkia azotoformans]|uniref:hypothetical protein n=1 Tax=Schinkia azotoformans TaxID=1454 RepID=UPI0005577B31|nr:hypothetical protein [Schinkia azotoformans]MEC1697535.1 hypothetical protein [Schinkia azotoformans]MEC1718726.1 hypothetical protein [Schinkia azotoformans]MEC1727552.1 hypothetical protein [Schinkia azotoformans]MEC1742990.1 hypothetical protein [Schinkia azotoformans]MEC1747649.1 hypothetical protein [Schinkia azotoformans]